MLLLVSWLLVAAFFGGLTYGHYYFGYVGEPTDNDLTCYASGDKDITVPWDLSLGDVPNSYHDVSWNFRLCARFGLVTFSLISCTLCSANTLVPFIDRCGEGTLVVPLVLGCSSAFMYVTYMLLVMIFRWRHDGKVCSGDYLESRAWDDWDQQEPYVRNAGSFLLIVICSQFFLFLQGFNAVAYGVSVDQRINRDWQGGWHTNVLKQKITDC